MRIISVNVGLPKEIFFDGKSVTTGIFKEPVQGRVRVNALHLDGDQQADLAVHGGPSKAVYAYPLEHYEFWRRELRMVNLSYGMFGENLTTEGMLEKDLCIGDRLCLGSAELMVTEPRPPCYKLNAKFGRHDMVKRFLKSPAPVSIWRFCAKATPARMTTLNCSVGMTGGSRCRKLPGSMPSTRTTSRPCAAPSKRRPYRRAGAAIFATGLRSKPINRRHVIQWLSEPRKRRSREP